LLVAVIVKVSGYIESKSLELGEFGGFVFSIDSVIALARPLEFDVLEVRFDQFLRSAVV